jgi:hypothetical protein
MSSKNSSMLRWSGGRRINIYLIMENLDDMEGTEHVFIKMVR